MPELTIRVAGGEERLCFVAGPSLKELLERTRFRVKARCNGNGSCGLCRVRIDSGRVNEPTGNERVYLDSGLLGQGLRLACQVRPEEDVGIQATNLESASPWKELFSEDSSQPLNPRFGTARELPVPMQDALGLAVDLGTTHLKFSLCDLQGKRRLAVRSCRNPQLFLGGDVITRLAAAPSSPEKAGALQGLISGAIREAAREITAELGCDPRQIVRASLVGNTAMLSLFTGINFSRLLHPSHWTAQIACIPDSTSGYAAAWNLHPLAEVEIIPPLGGLSGRISWRGCLPSHCRRVDREACSSISGPTPKSRSGTGKGLSSPRLPAVPPSKEAASNAACPPKQVRFIRLKSLPAPGRSASRSSWIPIPPAFAAAGS